MTEPAPLPFDAFLDVLRAKGYGIGLHEYAAMADLLAHWDRLHVSELGDALAALIGRGDEEVEGIRRLFEEIYAVKTSTTSSSSSPPPPVDRFAFFRRHVWTLALLSAAVMFGAALLTIFPRPSTEQSAVATFVPPVPTPSGLVVDPTLPPPPAPELPAPPQQVARRPATEVVGGAFLVALALFWSMKLRDDARRLARDAWSAVRGLLPGPYHFEHIMRDGSARLPKSDVEDAATLLGRVFAKTSQARELDVPRTVQATLRRGLMPTLITKPRRVTEPILVLQDVCQDMRLWDAKVETLLSDLRRQGIVPERMYFDGDLTRLSDRPRRPAKAIETVLRNRAAAPVLIVSSGAGLAALFEDGVPSSLRQLARPARATWLTPVTDLRLWPPAFDRLPMAVWPMTHMGLTNAARDLSGGEGAPGADLHARMTDEGRVSLADIERLKRLVSLVPHPSPALLDFLRRQYAPDIPDAAILHVMLEADGPSAPIIHLKDEELRRCLNAVRRENPDLETAARRTILEILRDSEPVAGSAAHERWNLAIEVQRLLLADVEGSHAAAARSLETLQALGQGPLWQELQDALRIVPGTSVMTEQVSRLSPKDRQGPVPPSEDTRRAGRSYIPWSWPGLREVVPAMLVAGLLLAGAVGLNALPARTVDHLLDAYRLDYLATASASTPTLSLAPGQQNDGLPRTVDLYQDDRVFRSGIVLTDGTPAVVQLTAGDTGHYYQVRATLAEQNLAVSRAVWATSDKLAFVQIDASPWANVTITGGQTTKTTAAAQQTPFTAALLPGTYQAHFENPNLTPPSMLDQTFTVPTADGTLHVVMPGFDAARTVDNLMQQDAARTPASAR